MWNNKPAAPKCPRGDCAYYELGANDVPCKSCTCNKDSEAMYRKFNYKAKDLPKIKKCDDNG